ncbi:MAG: aminopeptidase P family protein [Gemmatimonadaceae bacterium]
MQRPNLTRTAILIQSVIVVLALGVTPTVTTLGAQLPEHAERRARLFGALGDGVTLVFGAGEPSKDYLPWQQARPFLYLAGFQEPNAALVMVERGGTRQEMLFVAEKNPAQEVWTGNRLGVAGVREEIGIEGRDITTLRAVLDQLLQGGGPLYVAGDFAAGGKPRTENDQFLDSLRAAHPEVKVEDAAAAIVLLRGTKSASELARLRIAAEISANGHLAVMRAVRPGMGEFQAQAMAESAWMMEGAEGPGYASIVGSGPNATALHYNRNDRIVQAGEVIVMDMAASFDGYSADITRTVPVSGRFSPAQREIYQLVLDAQKAAERQVRVGGPSKAMTDSAGATLRAGLAKLGLIEAPDAMYDCGTAARARQCSQLSLYYMHGLGHGIGLDVHDPEQYYSTGVIDVGSAFTIEPGVYVRANLMDIIPDTPKNQAMKQRIAPAFAKYSGIGVRIEDDYLVTPTGVERPSAGVPREIADVERETSSARPPLSPVRRAP